LMTPGLPGTHLRWSALPQEQTDRVQTGPGISDPPRADPYRLRPGLLGALLAALRDGLRVNDGAGLEAKLDERETMGVLQRRLSRHSWLVQALLASALALMLIIGIGARPAGAQT